MKNKISDTWKNYIHKQVAMGVPKEHLKVMMKEQDYSNDIIEVILNPKPEQEYVYEKYVLDKINTLTLSRIEKKIVDFMKTQDYLLDKIKREKLVVIENWLEESIADHIYTLFQNNPFEHNPTTTSNRNKLDFHFYNIIQTPEIKRLLFFFNLLFKGNYVFHGGIGMSKYSKGSYIEEHTDHGGYLYKGEKYYRNISCVIYFNKHWNVEYGGRFIDIEGNTQIMPSFNKAVFFQIPHKHAVEKILTDNHRYAIFMFCSSKEKIYELPDYRFLPTSSLL